MPKKHKHTLQEVLENIKHGGLWDFEACDFVYELISRFLQNHPNYCSWCLLDAVYSCKSANLYPFFAEMLIYGRDWYEVATATDWLLAVDAKKAHNLIWNTLKKRVYDEDPNMRETAVRGIRNLNTKEGRTFLWEKLKNCAFESPEDTKSFQKMVEEILSKPPRGRNFHIIP